MIELRMENNLITWERAKRMAFWDQGQLTYKKWLNTFKARKTNVITQSINFMRASDLIDLLGQKEFIKAWPQVRQHEALSKVKKSILDGAWSFFVVGDVGFLPEECVTSFHPKKRNLLKVIAKASTNQSIYSIAKTAGRNHRRVYDDVHDFAAKGLLRLEEGESFGRKILIPRLRGCHYSAHS